MKTALQLRNILDDKMAKIKAIQTNCDEEQREPSEEEAAAINAFYGEDGKSGEYARLKSTMASRQHQEQIEKEYASQKLSQRISQGQQITHTTALVPAKAKRHGPLKAFSNDAEGEKSAYVAGKWMLANLFNHESSQRWLKEHGLFAQQEETATKGLELVPEPLEAAVLKRLEMLSTVLGSLRISTMTSATLKIPDRLTGVTVVYPDENAAITPSNMTFGQQLLTTRKMATLTQVGSELTEDSIVSIMDELASDIAYSLALKIEDDLVNGDGTGSYGSVTGVNASLNANSIVIGAGVSADLFTLANYEACVALNPFFQGSMPQWWCSSSVYASSMLPLLNAAGGTPGSEIASGFTRMFMGFPVNILQTMDKGTTETTPQVWFGTLSQSVYFGQRRGIQIATSEHYGFNTDSIYIRGTTRNAITVDNHDTVTAGPITAIATATT